MTTTGSVRPHLSDTQCQVLDDPVWHALTSVHASFAEGTGSARRYRPSISVFAAVDRAAADGWQQLAELVGPGETVVLARAGGITPPASWERLGGGAGFQMILDELGPEPHIDAAIEPLTLDHVPQMVELVELTKPGPFRAGTIELGGYVGVFLDGQLVAMAGQRVQTADFAEISAVCTHPSARGRGLAAAVSHRVATGIVQRGQTPVLHVAEQNLNAKRVYERLGFVARQRLEFLAFRTPEISA